MAVAAAIITISVIAVTIPTSPVMGAVTGGVATIGVVAGVVDAATATMATNRTITVAAVGTSRRGHIAAAVVVDTSIMIAMARIELVVVAVACRLLVGSEDSEAGGRGEAAAAAVEEAATAATATITSRITISIAIAVTAAAGAANTSRPGSDARWWYLESVKLMTSHKLYSIVKWCDARRRLCVFRVCLTWYDGSYGIYRLLV